MNRKIADLMLDELYDKKKKLPKTILIWGIVGLIAFVPLIYYATKNEIPFLMITSFWSFVPFVANLLNLIQVNTEIKNRIKD